MIGFSLALILLCALGYLGYRHQKLLIRCALAEEKVKNQEELRESFRIVSAEALESTNQTLFETQQKDLEEKQKSHRSHGRQDPCADETARKRAENRSRPDERAASCLNEL